METRKYKYRFKTKDEFIVEFGNNWRYSSQGIGSRFIPKMDYLLGQDIDEQYYSYIEKSGYFGLSDNIGNYGIEKYMYKKVSTIPTYKRKKFIY